MRIRPIAILRSKDRRTRVAALLGALVVSAGIGYTVRAARASGVPSTGALVYTGILTDAAGAALSSPQNVGVAIYDAQSAGNKVCERAAQSTTLDPAGRFQVTMPDTCAAAVGANSDLWVEVTLGGNSLGRSKAGAVPYAIEANNATRLQGLAPSQLMAPAGMIAMFDASCPSGWSLCDGSNGTPNMVGNYVKGRTAFAASAGQNTHSHNISLTTAAGGSHYHYAQIDWAANLYGHFANYSGDSSVVAPAGAGPWTATSHLTINSSGGLDNTTDNGGMLTTTVAAHTHGVSGVTADVNHEPAHVTVVFCRKN
jgi:hypothetical protein